MIELRNFIHSIGILMCIRHCSWQNLFVTLTLITSITLCKSLTAQECETLKVAGANRWLPVSYLNTKTRQPQGLAIDLIQYISRKLEIPLVIDLERPWKRVLSDLANGDIDLVTAIYKNHPRQAVYRFSKPYFTNQAHVFVLKGHEFPFDQLADLEKHSGGVPIGSSFGDEFDTFAKQHHLNLRNLKTEQQLLGMLQLGRIDYYIQDYLDATLYLKQFGLSDSVVALEHPVSTNAVHFAISRNSACVKLLPRINDIIITAKNNGALDAIIQRHLQ